MSSANNTNSSVLSIQTISEEENNEDDNNGCFYNLINKIKKIYKKIYVDSKYLISVPIMVFTIVTSVYITIIVNKISSFYILFDDLAKQKVYPIDINSINMAIIFFPYLVNNISNITQNINRYEQKIDIIIALLQDIRNNMEKYNL